MGMRKIFKRLGTFIAMVGLLSVGLAPVPVMADASNPRYVPRHAKDKAKPRVVRRAAAKPTVAPAPQQPAPVEVAQPAPAPVAEAPVATVVAEAPAPAATPAPAPAAAKLSVVKKGGNGTIIALLAAAGVIGGIALATSGSSVSR
jgi:hypothetical protein